MSDLPLHLAWQPMHAFKSDGYGFITKRFFRALRESGVTFAQRYDRKWDARIFIGVPNTTALGLADRVDDVVWHTMFEAEPLPPEWVDVLNRGKAVWVPSQYGRTQFRRAGVTVPILCAGYGVDSSVFRAVDREYEADRPLRFGIWVHSFAGRKNAPNTIRAWLNAAPLNSTLEIKVSDSSSSMPRHIEWQGKRVDDITIHAGTWKHKRLVSWLQEIDVLLYMSGGEGFGLQPLEFMATGGVNIVANNTGMTDYLTPKNAILIPCPTRKKSHAYEIQFPGHEYTIAEPDWDAVVEAIRRVARDRHILPKFSAEAIATSERWTWKMAAQVAISQLSQLQEQ